MAEHGTRSCYVHDFCRCAECRAANAAYIRKVDRPRRVERHKARMAEANNGKG